MEPSYRVATASGKLTDLNRVVGKLTRGREIADQLRAALRETRNTGSLVFPAGSMLDKISNSFIESLSILSAGGESDEISQVPALVYSPGRKSGDSGESHRNPAPKDRRGCYKRRRTSETWTKEAATLIEDGHAWRKYGQKAILHAKHPRSYYRCTHKFDQKCPATKQVQIIQDNPIRYKMTYHGRHTCKNLYQSPHQIIMDMAAEDSSIIWSFQAENNNNGAVINPAVKPEGKELYDQIKSSLSYSHEHDYFVQTDELKPFGSSVQFSAFSPGVSDHEDVISSDVNSCTASTHSFDNMDMMDFDDLVELEL